MPQTLLLFIARIQFNSLQMQPQSFLSDRKILLLSPWIEYLNPVEKLVELYSTGKNPNTIYKYKNCEIFEIPAQIARHSILQ